MYLYITLVLESMTSRVVKFESVGGGKKVTKREFQVGSEDDPDFDSFDVETLRAYAKHAHMKQRALIGYYRMCNDGSAGDDANEVLFDLEPEEFNQNFGIEMVNNDPVETLRALVYSKFEPPAKKIKIDAESDEKKDKDVSE